MENTALSDLGKMLLGEVVKQAGLKEGEVQREKGRRKKFDEELPVNYSPLKQSWLYAMR